MKTFTVLQSVAVFILLGSLATAARAHAVLDHADPKVGSKTGAAPTEIRLWFSEEIDLKSSVQVSDSAGKEVDAGDAHVDADDKTLLIVSTPSLLPGQYTVEWNAICLARHHTHGKFKFTIGGS